MMDSREKAVPWKASSESAWLRKKVSLTWGNCFCLGLSPLEPLLLVTWGQLVSEIRLPAGGRVRPGSSLDSAIDHGPRLGVDHTRGQTLMLFDFEAYVASLSLHFFLGNVDTNSYLRG